MRERIPLLVTVILVSVGLFFMLKGMMSPEMYRVTGPSHPINYIFVPDYDELSGSPHHVEGNFWSTTGDSVEVIVSYRSPEAQATEARLQRITGSNKFSFPLPTLPKGKRFFYFLTVKDAAGREVEIKPKPNIVDKLVSERREKLFYVTYEGRPPRSLLILHVGLILGALIFMVQGFHRCLIYLLSRRELASAYWNLLTGWFLFTVTVLPLGYTIAKMTFGVGWSGFPVGNDITDNKSLVVVLYWALLLVRSWKPQRGDYAIRTGGMSGTAFAWLSIIGIALTIVAYAIPHSIFVQ